MQDEPGPDPFSEADLDPDRSGAFLRSVGLRIDSLTGDEVLGHLDVTAEHHTPWGMAHGGLYTTVVESAASIGASYAVWGDGRIAIGVNNQTDFLRPHVSGRLDVRASVIQQGRTLQLWLVEITNEEGKTVARGQVRLINQQLPSR